MPVRSSHSQVCVRTFAHTLEEIQGLRYKAITLEFTCHCAQALEEMQAQGHRPDVGVYNVVIEALSRSGVLLLQLKAAQLFQARDLLQRDACCGGACSGVAAEPQQVLHVPRGGLTDWLLLDSTHTGS